MQSITLSELDSKYKVMRNPVRLMSPYENRMIDVDEDELDFLESKGNNRVWSLVEKNKSTIILKPGIQYEGNVLGFFLTEKKWSPQEEGYIFA